MQHLSYGNNNELVVNFIDPVLMLAHYLSYHRHRGCSEWIAEFRIKVTPDSKYYGTQYLETCITGNGERLTHDQALAIVYGYEREPGEENPDLAKFEAELLFSEWEELGPSPEVASE